MSNLIWVDIFSPLMYDLLISPDSQWIGTSPYANEYIIDNLKTRTSMIVTPAGDADALALSADSSCFITVTTIGDIGIWDVKTANQINSMNIGDSILSIPSSAAGRS
jgi:hypothetical protein